MVAYGRWVPLFCILLLFSIGSHGQQAINGYVTDEHGTKIAFVNVGVRGKNLGTYTDTNGRCSLRIPEANKNDTLTFSIVGFAAREIPIRELLAKDNTTVVLTTSPVALENTIVTGGKLVAQKIGISKYNPVIHFIDGSTSSNDIFEVAQLVHLPLTRTKLTSVNLFINDDRKDSGIFRINFYSIANGLPSKKLNKHDIIQRHAIKEGWLAFDLTNEKVYLAGDIVVGVEFIPAGKGDIKYEVKLGGHYRSYTRSSSLGEWHVPPHHYRMYVTALVADGQKLENEETGSSPTYTLYSKAIDDSFCLFVSVPGGYTRSQKRYPAVYILDANAYFDLLSNDKNNIIVGIGYKDAFLNMTLRDRDFTYPAALPSDSMTLSGGGPLFLQFLEREIVPFVDRTYRTDTSNRTLMGHSLGGFFTLYALLSAIPKGGPFRTFVAASPSLDYANKSLPASFAKIKDATLPQRLFMTTGTRENDPEPEALAKMLRNLHVDFIEMPGLDHMDTAVPTFEWALKIPR